MFCKEHAFFLASFWVLSLYFHADCQVIRFGSCPDIAVKENFNVSAYVGTWYEQQRYFAFFEWGLNCVAAEYTALSDGKIRVNNTGIKSNGQVVTAIGTGYAPDPKEPAKLLVKFDGKGPAGAYWVIETDYTAFSVVYACTNAGPIRLMNAWLLSRDREGFPHESIEKIERVLRDHNIEKSPFSPTDQTLECGQARRTQRSLAPSLI